jgi:catechol 2,3-dioxygenase-like lactoylglutathione lyase family enzyme
MEPFIDHIEITVRDLDTAVRFYDRLLPLLGFDLARRSEAVIEKHDKRVVSYEHARLGFAITSPLRAFANETINRRKPGARHHLAFRASSRAEVDALYRELREYPEYNDESPIDLARRTGQRAILQFLLANRKPAR